MKRCVICLFVAAYCAMASAQTTIRNPGFDDGLKEWEQRNSENMGEVRIADDGQGGKCAQYHKTVSTPGWSSIGLVQQLTVEPNSVYEISLRSKTALEKDAVGHAFRVFIGGESLQGKPPARVVERSAEWKEFRWRYKTGPETKDLLLSILLTYASGDVWVDDVSVLRVGQSIEAEAFPNQTGVESVADTSLSGAKGLRLNESGAIVKPLNLRKGAWRVEVFGTSDGKAQLWPRAVRVKLGEQEKLIDLHRNNTHLRGRNALFQIDNPGEYVLTISKNPDYKAPVVLDRVFYEAHNGPARVAPLCLETKLVADGKPDAVIVASDDPEMQKIAQAVQKGIQDRSGAVIEIVNDASWMKGDRQSRNAISVGNMIQNKLTERLYCLWYAREDCWYPGKGGWVVRTVHDPWGAGTNVVVLAGSDVDGTREAAAQFLSLLKPGKDISLGHTIKVKMREEVAKACGKPNPDYAKKSLPRRGQRTLMSSSARCGMQYLCTGDPGFARMFVTYLMEHKRRGDLGHGTHMELWKTIRGWDNLEECPALTDAERLEVVDYLLYVLRSEEGVQNGMFVGSLGYSSVRHNHHMLAAMCAYYGGHYFGKYYNVPDADEWFAKAKFCFDSQELQDKGQDESGNYEGSTALRPLLPYAYTEPGYRFLPSGTAKRFIDRVCVSIDNRFSSSGHGDCWDINCFPPLSISIGAWYYRDGAYQYIMEGRFKQFPSERDRMQTQPPFRVEGDIPPTRPDRFEGIVVAPLNREHYDFYKKRQSTKLKWNLPWEQTFDKISFRTRFEPDKQYLVLDGIACGSHGHYDPNCIIRFTDNNRVWIVDDSYTEGPFLPDHNGVLVTRNGIAEDVPACARLDDVADLGDVGITRTTLPDHSGVDWERNIIWVKEKCFLVLDRMGAIKPGNYGFRCKWRTLGRATLDGNTLITRQEKKTPDRKNAFRIVHGGDVETSFITDRGDFGKQWTRYEYAEPVVNICSQDVSRELEPGKAFTFTNLLYATNVDHPFRLQLAKLDERSAFIDGEQTMLAGIADGGYEAVGLTINAHTFLIRRQGVAMTGAGSLALDGKPLFASTTPVAVSMDLAQGTCVVLAKAQGEVSILGQAHAVKPGRNELRAAGLSGLSFEQVLKQARAIAEKRKAAVAGRPEAKSTANISVVWEFNAGAPVSAMALNGDHIVVGTDDGSGIGLDADGKELWRIKAEVDPKSRIHSSRINAVSAGDLTGDGKNEIVFASENASIYALDRSGKELWRFTCPVYPKRGGKYGQARDVLVSDLDGDGKAEVIIAPNNIQLHILNHDGTKRLTAKVRDPKMTCNNLSTLDVDGDGKKTVFAFPSSGSFGSGIELELNGRLNKVGTDGWPSHIRDRAECDLNGDGKTDFACGTNRGNIYYRVWKENHLGNTKVFSLGCPVTAMTATLPTGKPGRVAVGVDASYVHLLDGAGKSVWSRATGSPVTDVTFMENGILAVGTAAGHVLFYDGEGNPVGRFVAGAGIAVLRPRGASVFAACSGGKVRKLEIQR